MAAVRGGHVNAVVVFTRPRVRSLTVSGPAPPASADHVFTSLRDEAARLSGKGFVGVQEVEDPCIEPAGRVRLGCLRSGSQRQRGTGQSNGCESALGVDHARPNEPALRK